MAEASLGYGEQAGGTTYLHLLAWIREDGHELAFVEPQKKKRILRQPLGLVETPIEAHVASLPAFYFLPCHLCSKTGTLSWSCGRSSFIHWFFLSSSLRYDVGVEKWALGFLDLLRNKRNQLFDQNARILKEANLCLKTFWGNILPSGTSVLLLACLPFCGSNRLLALPPISDS